MTTTIANASMPHHPMPGHVSFPIAQPRPQPVSMASLPEYKAEYASFPGRIPLRLRTLHKVIEDMRMGRLTFQQAMDLPLDLRKKIPNNIVEYSHEISAVGNAFEEATIEFYGLN
ncbi:MAG: hypothetical protein ACPGXY_04735 [Alphaproteobacteria bacterium]